MGEPERWPKTDNVVACDTIAIPATPNVLFTMPRLFTDEPVPEAPSHAPRRGPDPAMRAAAKAAKKARKKNRRRP